MNSLRLGSMILLKVDKVRIALAELECNAPGPVHVDGIADRFEPLKRMEVESRDIQVSRRRRAVQHIQSPKNASLHSLIDPTRGALFPELPQGPGSKAFDHAATYVP